MLDYYKILGVSATSSFAEIKSAFRRRVKELHPDLHPTSDRLAFQQVVEAYRVLSEPYSRKQYDLYWSLFSSFSASPALDLQWPLEWLTTVLQELSPLKYLENLKSHLMNKVTGELKMEFPGNVAFSVPLFVPFPSPKVDLREVTSSEWFSLGNRYFRLSVVNSAFLYYQQALDALKKNTLTKAEKLLLRSLKIQPQFVLAYLTLGNIYQRLGDYERAKRCFRKVQELDSSGVPGQIATRYLQSLL
ncbi:DnaJ domain-containing protein [candidate division CSSED10-310 bacterium]|uniref:DnaJ domain-containing protein n=1 Tax=candidate division CSSED10-310 bacterium TaxID=2855610 RepID=A0ABV6YSB5_UNCC1